MNFRERPEYQDWRDAVFQLFGRECILCRHGGNIQAHHVRPVNTYPELAFEPKNGVPLCGNCHAEVKGNELAYVDEFERRQRAILGGETAAVASNGPDESVLRERAYAEPCNAEAVEAWFRVADSQAVIDFHDQYRKNATQTACLCLDLARHMQEVGRWQDSLEVAEQAIGCAEREGVTERLIRVLGPTRSCALDALGRFSESAVFLRQLLTRFPEVANLHHRLSISLRGVSSRAGEGTHEKKEALEESVRHALKAAQLAPGDSWIACQASTALMEKGDHAAALHYGKRALELASTGEEKRYALDKIAAVYISNNLYSDARKCLRELLESNESNVNAIGTIALCYWLEGKQRDAL